MDFKEESCLLDFSSENERYTKDRVKKVKIADSSDTKPELEDSICCSQNEEQHLMRFNETIKESEIETKIDIKEEYWFLEGQDSCINGDIKDETREDFYPTKPSLYKEGVSHYTPDLFSNEDLGDGISFKMNVDGPECENDRKCLSQKSVATDASSIETSVCSETSDDGKIVSMASSLEQSKLLQKSNTKCLNQLSSLETHKLIGEGGKILKCNICKKTFTKLHDLKRHKLTHEGIKPHKCNICSKAFGQSSDLKRHKLIHEGIKPHKCDICNKTFTQFSDLKKHKLIHEGIKPHKCDICNKTFTQSSDLKKHQLIHEGIKPHKCNICNKTFTQSSDLKKHELVHEGVKPHKCDICKKTFTQSSNLKAHKFIHEGIKPYECNFCTKAFTRLSHLKTHKLVHENIKAHM